MGQIGIAMYDRSLKWPIQKLYDAIKSKGHLPVPFRLSDVTVEIGKDEVILAGSNNLIDLDILFLRTIGSGNCDQITYRISVLDHLEKTGVTVINAPYPFRHAKDKYISLVLLNRADLPIIDTVLTENQESGYNYAKKYQDTVIKPLIGSQGLGVIHAENPDLAFRALKLLTSTGQVSYIQRYLEKSGGDIRVFVIDGQVISAMERRSNSWKTNISQGAKPKSIKLDTEISEIAIKSIDTLGLYYGGVDILVHKGKPYIIEVNAAPSWKGLQEITDFSIADHLVDFALALRKK